MRISPSRLAQDSTAVRLPALDSVLRSCAPLPPSALFVGLAHDGLPVLLNLHEASPSAVLVVGDTGSGKTRLLKTVARAIELTHDPDEVRYAVITTSPSEWANFGSAPHCEGILSFHHALTTGYMASLVRWTRSGETESRPRYLVLLIDDLWALSGDGDLRASRDWVMSAGPAHGLRPIATLSPSESAFPDSWLAPFSSRLFGRLQNGTVAQDLLGSSEDVIGHVQPGSHFAMREAGAWLSFSLPELD